MVHEINSRLENGQDPPMDAEGIENEAILLGNRVGQVKLPQYLQHVLTAVLLGNEKGSGLRFIARLGALRV
jgi:hypothetical protein